jgi:hypothetical protein
MTACIIKAENLPSDTVFQYNRKYIKVEEDSDRIKVNIFEKNESDGTVPYKQLYEGIFSDEKSYEKWTVQEAFDFNVPFLRKKKKHPVRMDSHWDGVGIGFANIADKSLNMTEVNGVSIDASSFEWFFNLFGGILPIYRNNLGITSGAGMSWLNLRLDKNTHFVNNNGVTGVYPAPDDDIRYSLSRLMVVHINIPLMLEWQPTIAGNHKAFLSAGIVGGVKTFSSYKVKYKNREGKTVTIVEDRGLNTTPLSLDYMVQAGYDDLCIYAKYSPFSIFQSNKGPDIRAVSLGIMFCFR